jgi:hypothetical protein
MATERPLPPAWCGGSGPSRAEPGRDAGDGIAGADRFGDSGPDASQVSSTARLRFSDSISTPNSPVMKNARLNVEGE